ncbi:hypothetical protein SF83666_c02210 [Sinorhizobium fredii CCBAU 83666]|nr:hypothetical protein SF83666_c02210 [Sinorhizobium fredii CCBAU 83666]
MEQLSANIRSIWKTVKNFVGFYPAAAEIGIAKITFFKN